MVKIAVCEDNPITRRLIVEMINNIKLLTVFTVSQFSSKADFNDDEPLNSDIILMSCDFNSKYGKNGFEITRSLREKGCNANIIFGDSPFVVGNTYLPPNKAHAFIPRST